MTAALAYDQTDTRATLTGRGSVSLFPPAEYREVLSRPVTVDGGAAILTRHERADGRNTGLGGEHFSTLVDESGLLKGFVRFEEGLAAGALPEKEAAHQVAQDFLAHAAPDLRASLELHWIDRHDETIAVGRSGQRHSVTIPGIKVKMRNPADGRWFWVIVGTDGKPIVFERDIVWITFPGHRQTEKWLHDEWLLRQDKAEY